MWPHSHVALKYRTAFCGWHRKLIKKIKWGKENDLNLPNLVHQSPWFSWILPDQQIYCNLDQWHHIKQKYAAIYNDEYSFADTNNVVAGLFINKWFMDQITCRNVREISKSMPEHIFNGHQYLRSIICLSSSKIIRLSCVFLVSIAR